MKREREEERCSYYSVCVLRRLSVRIVIQRMLNAEAVLLALYLVSH